MNVYDILDKFPDKEISAIVKIMPAKKLLVEGTIEQVTGILLGFERFTHLGINEVEELNIICATNADERLIELKFEIVISEPKL